jgi:UDP:flavonoid glycosyltransferase YjiC (YdhE family)
MRSAYASALVFLAPEPSMPMPGLTNVRPIGPIGRRGSDGRAHLRDRLGLESDRRLVLLSLGGVPFSIDIGRWPRLEGVHVLAAMTLEGTHPDVTDAGTLQISHIDLLASCDAVVTKPGYGTVTEAAVNGTPMLYVTRDGWPEEPYLVEWLRRVGRCESMPRAALIDGAFAQPLGALLRSPRPAPTDPRGVIEAVRALLDLL